MNPIAQDHPTLKLWHDLLSTVRQLLAERGAHADRTVVLVPYAQLMPLAGSLWAERWPHEIAPRFESTMNWAGGMRHEAAASDMSFDTGRDLLTARSWLNQAGLAGRADLLAGRLIEAAWPLGAVAAAVPPGDRPAWAQSARLVAALGQDTPVLALESAVARIAVEWAAASSYATDALLQEQVAGSLDLLVVLQGLQAEPMAGVLTSMLGDRAVTLAMDVPAPVGEIGLHEAADPSQEAAIAAACVMRHIEAGRVPVALPAVDRALTRRIRGMLEARGVAIRDETGWKLSTTRAAAHVMSALRAVAWNAGSDVVLDWLKNLPAVSSRTASALERRVRREGLRDWAAVNAGRLGAAPDQDGAADADGTTAESESWVLLIAQANVWRDGLQRARPLPDWLETLRDLLQASGRWARLLDDGAGLQVLTLLGLHGDTQAQWQLWSDPTRRLSLADFTAWVSDALEAANFVPPHPAREQVVILPLNQLLGRVMGALVVAGCDEVRLAPSPEPGGVWTTAQREGLGLPSREALEAQVRDGWRSAMQTPHCDVVWRRSDDSGEPLLASALVLSLRLQGLAHPADDPRELRVLPSRPPARPLPSGMALKIETLSASGYEDLRRCPYSFFALRQLGLHESDEIDTELGKRDFGNWLHKVLGAFHEALQGDGLANGVTRAALLDATAARVTRSLMLADGEFLPFAAAWPQVRAGYLAWLAGHEATGATFERSESAHEMVLGSVTLVGRIDRIDRLRDGRPMVMDYKTEARAATGERTRQSAEDTQLAFYAALLEADTLRGAYVNVGERGRTETVEHMTLVEGRDQLVQGILHDLERIAGGALLPALGEGKVCDFCAARGLCRRDFWA